MELPIVEDCIVTGTDIAVGSDAWFKWLRNTKSFKYKPVQTERFTLLRDITIRNRSGDYWYGYRKVNNQLRQVYVSTTEDLDRDRLQKAVVKLSDERYESKKFEARQRKVIQPKTCTTKIDESIGCTTATMYNQSQATELEEQNKQLQMQLEQLTQDYQQLQLQLEETKLELSARKELQQLQLKYSELSAVHEAMKLDFLNMYSKILLKIQPGYITKSATALFKDIDAIFKKHLEVPPTEE